MVPHPTSARAITAGGLRWQVKQAGQPDAPGLLLLHGTGSSWRSWQGCLPALAARCHVVAMDLPGHGGTCAFADHQASLPRMATAVAALLQALPFAPLVVAGHSAGAAVMAQLALDGHLPKTRGLLAVNGALQPLPGLAGWLAPAAARLASRHDWLPAWVTRHAAEAGALTRLIASTGSRPDPSSLTHYGDLLRQPEHVRGVLDMLAHWQLDTLHERLHDPSGGLRVPLWLAAGLGDRTLAPVRSLELARRVPGARFVPLPGLGHLAHEEAPQAVVTLLLELLDQTAADTAA